MSKPIVTTISYLSSFSASCDTLTALPNGKVNSNYLKHGSLAYFSCNTGFQLEGPKQITCIDGKWNSTSPTCKGLRHSYDRIYLSDSVKETLPIRSGKCQLNYKVTQ